MPVLVTGGAGFIGSHLVDALIGEGEEVVVVDNLSAGQRESVHPAATLEIADIRDLEALTEIVAGVRPRTIFHLAALVDVVKSVADPATDFAVNVAGSWNVVQAARTVGAKIVFSSSCAVYGDYDRPAAETDQPLPLSPYGAGKLAAEALILGARGDAPHTALRYANVYGPRQGAGGEGGVISIFLDRARRGAPLTVYGSGRQTRDFVYVGDVVQANLRAATVELPGPFNISTGVETSVRALAELVAEIAGEVSVESAPARPGEIEHSVLANDRARAELGFVPVTRLAAGLRAIWLTS